MPPAIAPRAKFTEGSILRHVASMTATGSIGLVAIFIVDLVNLFYISLLGVAELAAAIGFSGAVLFFQTSICIGISIGIGAVVGRAIGAGERETARRLAGTGLVVMTVAATLAGFLILPVLDSILAALGANGPTLELASGYLHIVSPSLPLMGLGMGFAALLRAVGDGRRAMNVTLYGAFAAALIDPLLILWLDLELTGAAIATILSRSVLMLIGWNGAARIHGIVGKPTRADFAADTRKLLNVAGPAILTNVATPVAASFITLSLARFGDAAVAGQATVDRLAPVAFGVIFALTGAVGPVFAQNLGAGRFDRVQETLRAALILVLGYVLMTWIVLFLGQDLLIRAFSAQGVAAELIRLFCNVVAGSALFLGCLFVANAAFNNLGFPLLSTAFNWGRATLGTIPFAALGAHLGGAQGVILGQAFGTILFGSLALLVAFRVVRRLGPGSRQETGPSFWRPLNSSAGSGRAAMAVSAAGDEQER